MYEMSILMLQINSLMKNLKHERTPILKKYITLPILLSPERDDELLKISDQACTVGIWISGVQMASEYWTTEWSGFMAYLCNFERIFRNVFKTVELCLEFEWSDYRKDTKPLYNSLYKPVINYLPRYLIYDQSHCSEVCTSRVESTWKSPKFIHFIY